MSALTLPVAPILDHAAAMIYRLSIDQYHEMVRVGILTADDPIEFLEGLLVVKMPKNTPHTFVTEALREGLSQWLPAGWYLRTQEPITLPAIDSEPEPDVAVVKGGFRDYRLTHPGVGEIALLIEVADSTLARDRGMKLQAYARAGVAIYWIANIVDAQIEVYTDPTQADGTPTYRATTIHGRGGSIPIVIAGREVGQLPVDDLFPEAS